MTSKIEIVQRAAFLTGNGALISLDDGGDVATGVNLCYESVVAAALTDHGTKFSRRTLPLQLTTQVPIAPWTGVYAAPVNMLSIDLVQTAYAVRIDYEECDTDAGRGVQVAGDWGPYADYAASLITTGGMFSGPYAVGAIRVDEAHWPADFAMGIQQQMEAVFLSGIAEQRTAAGAREQKAGDTLLRARVRDKRGSTSTDASDWDLTAARRRGGAWSAWRDRGAL